MDDPSFGLIAASISREIFVIYLIFIKELKKINLRPIFLEISINGIFSILYSPLFILYSPNSVFCASIFYDLLTFISLKIKSIKNSSLVKIFSLAQKDVKKSERPPKYEKSGLSRSHSEAIWNDLMTYFEKELPYLDKDLNLKKLSAKFNVSEKIMSQIINVHASKNYYDLVNEYRIRRAKLLLSNAENAKRKLFDIAVSSGYSSQSTFYLHFKKQEGLTPKQYRTKQANFQDIDGETLPIQALIYTGGKRIGVCESEIKTT